MLQDDYLFMELVLTIKVFLAHYIHNFLEWLMEVLLSNGGCYIKVMMAVTTAISAKNLVRHFLTFR